MTNDEIIRWANQHDCIDAVNCGTAWSEKLTSFVRAIGTEIASQAVTAERKRIAIELYRLSDRYADVTANRILREAAQTLLHAHHEQG